MFKDMNKFEKAGLVIGTIECIAGVAISIYGIVGYKKAMRELEEEKLRDTAETMRFMDPELRD